jgi:hypothetical protein
MGEQMLLIEGLHASFGTVIIRGGITGLFCSIAQSQLFIQLGILFSAGAVIELCLWLRLQHLRAVREQRLSQRLAGSLRRSAVFSSQGLEFSEHRGDEFGDRGVDVNGSLDYGVGYPSVHDIQDRVDGLIATDA